MGALTINRRRDHDHFSLSFLDSDCRAGIRVSKKPKVSSMQLSPDRLVSLKSTISKIYWYPEPTRRLQREVHAPCRQLKFGASTRLRREPKPGASGQECSKEERVDEMGTSFSRQAKNTASSALKHRRKGKEVNDVEVGCSKDVISEDSSIEEIVILDDGREGQSVDSVRRSQQVNDDEFLQEAYEKFESFRPQPTSSAVSDMTNLTPKVDDAGMAIESLSMRGLEELRVPPHKKLYKSADRRNPKLGFLKSQIRYFESKLLSLVRRRPAKKPEEDVLRELFVPLTEEEEDEVSWAFSGRNRRKVLVTHENSNIEITGEVLQCLRPGVWLNDEVINVYLELLKERENREPKKFLRCHFFNTFFYKKLMSGRNVYDYKAVRRWTTQRKIGYSLLECDKIFVPIHKNIHWCLAIINKKEEKFQYLDSLKGIDREVMEVLARYFVDEVKDKSGEDINVDYWRQEYVDDLPEQENGWDCGMFMVKYIDFYSRGAGLCFKQEHMSYFRMRMAKEILRLKAD